MGLTYKDAGVDISAGEKAVQKISKEVKSTFGPEVLTGLGGFAALFQPDLQSYEEPVLVSGTDGVGTKLKIAFMMERHNTVGIDLVAMCVNDILAQGARPLFFLDYLAIAKVEVERVKEIVEGITEGCRKAGCALIGGETAEMPDFYQKEEYDLAGFAVGLVDRSKIITGEKIQAGDKIIGLASSGIHSNGYSLARKVFFEMAGYRVDDKVEGLKGTLGDELLIPTRIYVKSVLGLLKKYDIKGIAHITGGGMAENISRILPAAFKAVIEKSSWSVHRLFNLIQELGKIEEKEMYRVFNMGIGMVLIISDEEASDLMRTAEEFGERVYLIGEIEETGGTTKVEVR